MPCRLPERLYHPLHDLARHWGVGMSDLRQWLAAGAMTAVVWLPLMTVVDRMRESDKMTEPVALHHWEGYVRVSEHQSGRIFRQGWAALREFTTLDGARSFRLPETSDDVIVDPGDLLVLEAERKRMETQFPGLAKASLSAGETQQRSAVQAPSAIDPTYRIVRVNDRDHRFGETQAHILRLLAKGAHKGEPWQSGKLLLSLAGSQSFSISNLFKRHPVWRELVSSNKRGFYRLDERFLCDPCYKAKPEEGEGRLKTGGRQANA